MKFIKLIRSAALLAAAALLSTTAFSQELSQDPAIMKGQLSNGFTYIIRKNTVPKKRVSIYLVVKAGSVLENDGQRGLAHFMEHMSFNGTTHFPENSLIEFLQKTGVRFGADLNAYTSFDETVYQLPLATDKDGLVDKGLQVIRDWAQDATLDQSEIDKERGVVLEEKRMRSGLQSRISDRLLSVMYNHSKYASRLPIGIDTVLKNFKRDAILSFYQDWYRPDLEGIIVVGDIDPGAIEQKIKRIFGDLKSPADSKPRPDYQIPLDGTPHYAVIADKEIQGSSLQVMYKFPHKKLRTNADYLDYIKRNLFNLALSNRLQSVYQKNASYYLGAGATVQPLIANIDAFTVNVSTKNGQLKQGFQVLWTEIIKIRDEGFTETEIQTAKTLYLSKVQSQAEESDKVPNGQLANEYVRLFLQGEASPGIVKEAELTTAYLPTVSAAHLKQMAKRYLSESNRDVIVTGPEDTKDRLPDEAELATWLEGVPIAKFPATVNEITTSNLQISPLLSSLNTPGQVKSNKAISSFGGRELILSNGVRIIVKPTKFQNSEILFSAFSPGGTSVIPDADFRSAASAAEIISQSGLGQYDAETLRLKLSGKVANVSPFINERFSGLYGASNGADLETALQLVYLYFTGPRRDTALFNSELTRLSATLANKVSTPESEFADTVNSVLTQNAFRRKPISLTEVSQINLDKVLDIYNQQFSDASNFTFVFVGNIDLETSKHLFEKYLGSLPAKNGHGNWRDLNITIPRGQVLKTVKAGNDEKATVSLVISGDHHFSTEENVKLEGLRQMLAFHLLERLREKESGVYSPRVNLSIAKWPSQYTLTVSFTCAPANVEKLIAATWDEVESIKNAGPTENDLKKFQSEELAVIESSLENNGFWLTYLNNQYQNGEDPAAIEVQKGLIKSFKSSDYQHAAQRYLTKQNYIRFVKLPK